MTVPLRDRLAEIMADAWPLTDMPPWEGATEPERDSWREVAAALLASEEWHAREAVVEAARVLVGVGTGQQTQGAQHLLAERSAWRELRAALIRFDADRGDEKTRRCDHGYTDGWEKTVTQTKADAIRALFPKGSRVRPSEMGRREVSSAPRRRLGTVMGYCRGHECVLVLWDDLKVRQPWYRHYVERVESPP